MFDLSIGYTVGLSALIVAKYLTTSHPSLAIAVLLALGVGLAVGVLNGLVCLGLKIDSFIATLATGALILGAMVIISGDQLIVPFHVGPLNTIEGFLFGQIIRPVGVMIVVAIIIWYGLEFTPTGRRVFAVGFGLDQTRLMGVRTVAIRFGSLVVSAMAAAIAGLLLVAQVGEGDPTAGPSYLLPAFAAVFLGATQLRQGKTKFNVGGTVIAVFVLATAAEGLFYAGAPVWTTDIFDGGVLIAAVTLSGTLRGRGRGFSRLLGRRVSRAKGSEDVLG
jgi:ribose transport system permease protein